MKITFLGTNGWYTTEMGNTICTLVETEKCYIVFDAGEGFWKANEYINKDLPVFLFLSHLHLDHIFGLHILPRMNFKERLTIIVPETKHDDLMRVTTSPFSNDLSSMKVSVLSVVTGKIDGLLFGCQCEQLRHQDEAFGYRIDVDEKAIAYCSDTGYCDGAIALAKDSDVLIHECTNKPSFADQGWGHTNPQEAANVAKEANAKKLFLTHFMPDFYPTLGSRKEAEKAAKEIFENSIAATDDLELTL